MGSSGSSRSTASVLCGKHSLHYDPAKASGCVLCRREQRELASVSGRGIAWFGGILALGLVALAAAAGMRALVHREASAASAKPEGAPTTTGVGTSSSPAPPLAPPSTVRAGRPTWVEQLQTLTDECNRGVPNSCGRLAVVCTRTKTEDGTLEPGAAELCEAADEKLAHACEEPTTPGRCRDHCFTLTEHAEQASCFVKACDLGDVDGCERLLLNAARPELVSRRMAALRACEQTKTIPCPAPDWRTDPAHPTDLELYFQREEARNARGPRAHEAPASAPANNVASATSPQQPPRRRTRQEIADLFVQAGFPTDEKGRILMKGGIGGLTMAFDPSLRTPGLGLGACFERIQLCLRPLDGTAGGTLDSCVASVPRCTTNTPWDGKDPAGEDCCPVACVQRYAEARRHGPASAADVFSTSGCYPGTTPTRE
jgi:hypothetical protein